MHIYQPFTGVVRHLVIINALFFIASFLPMVDAIFPLGRGSLACYPPGSEYFHPWQIFTYMFMHANLTHLIFNMLALYMFGAAVESIWGPQRFLTYYLICGLGALVLHLVMQEAGFMGYSAVWGASGAVFGVMVAFAWNFPHRKIALLFPPIEMRAPYFVLALAAIDLMGGLGVYQSKIANFAHLGGAFTGFLYLYYKAGFRLK
jgi:membrane associated rhomboid family serine protease